MQIVGKLSTSKAPAKTARLYEMDLLQPGNEVEGLAIIEAPATTLPVPGGKKVAVDEYKRIWVRNV